MAEFMSKIQRFPSSDRLEMIDETDAILQGFKTSMEETYPKASSVYEAAKWLYQQVYDLRSKDQANNNDAQVAALYQSQAEKWSQLEADAAELQAVIKNKYGTVESAETRIKKARGSSGPSRAALGFPTPNQKLARYVFDKKFKYKFHDAKSEISMMCDFPDGMLVQVRLLHKNTEKMAEVGGEPTPKPVVQVNPQLGVTDQADAILQEFKVFMKQAYTKSSSLYERAKW